MNIAFVTKTENGIIFSRSELTELGRFEFEKTLTGKDKLEGFLYVNGLVPNIDVDGWNELTKALVENPRLRKSLEAILSWIKVRKL